LSGGYHFIKVIMKREEILNNLTLREKAQLLTGKDFWQTRGFDTYGIPSMFFSDGPHGLRKQAAAADHLGLNVSIPATCFPTAATMANSWNTRLGEELGKALGEEAATQNVNVVLGPGICMKRNPRCGRNFEYFSEDPYLAGKFAAAYVRGIQQNGTSGCIKHFAANNQEERRMVSDSIMDERTLREIYLTAFEIAVKEGKSKAVMSSYNKINGTFADENTHLIRDILRGEWGFDGVVISDWAGCNNKVASTLAGSDIEMPACRYGTDDIVKAVESGKLDIKYVDECVGRIVDLALSTSIGEKGKDFDKKAHHKLAQKCAEESIVLLKNDGILPLKHKTKIALVGDFAAKPRYQGAGSSIVNPTKLNSVCDVINGYDWQVVGFEKGFNRYGKKSNKLIKKATLLASKADVVLLFLGLDEVSEAEGLDRENVKIPANQIELYKAIKATGKKVIVVLSCGSAVELEFLNDCNALVYSCLSGQAGAEAVLNVLIGDVNPSGKLAETFPIQYKDCSTYNYFPGKKNTVEYREGLFIGYRYYDTANVKVAYPFGFGLSYTTFAYSDLQVAESGVTLCVTNTGNRNGAEVVQLYVGKKDGKIFRPAKELKGFAKVFLQVGEGKQVTIPFDDKTFRYFNVATNSWEVEGGSYQIYVGASSADIRLNTTIEREGTTEIFPYDRRVLQSYYSGKVSAVSDVEFTALLNHDIPKSDYRFYRKNRMVMDENSTVSDLRYSKRWIGRLFSWMIRFAIGFCKTFGMRSQANTLVMGMLHQPVRGLAKFSGMSRRQMESLLLMFNGHLCKGLVQFLTKDKKVKK
jgi:beta-glucosidase